MWFNCSLPLVLYIIYFFFSLVKILTVKVTIVIYLYYSIKEGSNLLWVSPKTNGAVGRS